MHWFIHALGPNFAHFTTTMLSLTLFPRLVELIPKAISQGLFARLIANQFSSAGVFTAQQISYISKDRSFKSHSNGSSKKSLEQSNDSGCVSSSALVLCQLYNKQGHIASKCWGYTYEKKKKKKAK